MALTQEEWFTRLKRWTPNWFLLTELRNVALLNGMAKLLAERGSEVEAILANDFILTAESEWLQLLGHERSVDLLDGESLDAYRIRVRAATTVTKISKTSIEDLVESLITTGTFWVRDDFDGSSFCDNGYYCDNRDVIFSSVLNGFTIFVDNQGSIETLQAIVAAVSSVKAFGCLYRLIERAA